MRTKNKNNRTPINRERRYLILDIILLALFSVIFLLVSYEWLKLSPNYSYGDGLGLLRKPAFFSLLFKHGLYSEIIPAFSGYPPLMPLFTVLLYRLFGESWTVSVFSQTVFIIPLIFSMYFLGRMLGGRMHGWIVVLLTASSQTLFIESKTYQMDFPLTAFVALLLLFIFLSRGYTRPLPSIAVGISLGLGSLAKYMLPFAFFPLLFSGAASLYNAGKNTLSRLILFIIFGTGSWAALHFLFRKAGAQFIYKHYTGISLLCLSIAIFLTLLLVYITTLIKKGGLPKTGFEEKDWLAPFYLAVMLIMAFGIAFPWHGAFFSEISGKLEHHFFGYYAQNASIPSLLWSNVKNLNSFMPLALLFIVISSLYIILFKRKFMPVILLLSFWCEFFFITFIEVYPAPRYLLPLLPLVILVGTAWMPPLKNIFKVPIFILIVVWAVLQLIGWHPFIYNRLPEKLNFVENIKPAIKVQDEFSLKIIPPVTGDISPAAMPAWKNGRIAWVLGLNTGIDFHMNAHIFEYEAIRQDLTPVDGRGEKHLFVEEYNDIRMLIHDLPKYNWCGLIISYENPETEKTLISELKKRGWTPVKLGEKNFSYNAPKKSLGSGSENMRNFTINSYKLIQPESQNRRQ
ncbi:MAG: glycosyltransferase family 39 protein [Chloroflexi bacterium]|nr:glycosyltransferase family 39 protein [Chloroflexota bacterium]